MRQATPPAASFPPALIDDPVPRSAEEDRIYYLRRAEDHDRLAAQSGEDGHRALHAQFAALYRSRAGQRLAVEDDQ